MVREFQKPPAARALEARGRARLLGVRVAVVVEARRYVTVSQTQPGTIYAIERTPVGWACSCEGFEYTGCCKHLGAVERRAEREGWDFGRIAPLATVGRYFPLALPDRLLRRGAVVSGAVAPATPAQPAQPAQPAIPAQPAAAVDLAILQARAARARDELFG